MSQISVDDSPLSSTAPSVGGILNIASLAAAAAQMIEKQRQSEGGQLSQDLIDFTYKKEPTKCRSQKQVTKLDQKLDIHIKANFHGQ
jgi:hypothetical protein